MCEYGAGNSSMKCPLSYELRFELLCGLDCVLVCSVGCQKDYELDYVPEGEMRSALSCDLDC